MNLIVSIVVTCACLPWPGLILMSPMMIASRDFASSKNSVFMAMLFFIYPSVLFLLLKVLNISFYSTDPLLWALAVFALGMLVSLAYRLPQRLCNLYRGIANYGYHIWANSVYFNGERILGADASTFVYYYEKEYFYQNQSQANDTSATEISFYYEYYSKDKNHVYYRTKKLPDADAATFGPLANDDSKTYWHDKKHVYYKWMRLPEADGASFRYLGHRYACDKERVFYENKSLQGAEVSTFRPMEGNVGKDAQRVFVQALAVDNVKDVPSFETMKLDETWFGCDNTQVYFICYAPPSPILPFADADRKTFELLGDYYAKDKNNVYYYSHNTRTVIVLDDANPATFHEHFDAEKNTDATDGINYYRSGVLYDEDNNNF